MGCRGMLGGVGSYDILSLDKFVGTNGTLLTAHTPNVGPAWTLDPASDPSIQIQSNQASSAVSAGNGVTIDRTSNYSVSVDWIPTTNQLNSANEIEVQLRLQDGSNYFDFALQGNGHLTIDTVFSGSFTNRASANLGVLTAGNRYTVKGSWSGDTLTVTVNGANAITYTDASLNTTGLKCELILIRTNDTMVAENWQITSP